jgi:site-specific recombinase XerD
LATDNCGEFFEKVKHSALVKFADAKNFKKKTYNKVVSALRYAFAYGYRDHPENFNPASS